MSRRNSTVSNASSVSDDDNTYDIYSYFSKLSEFSKAPELATYADYKFYMCWGGGPVGGFITNGRYWYKINKNGMCDTFTIEKLNNVEVDITYDKKTPQTINVYEMPTVKLTKKQFYAKLATHFKDNDFNPRVYHDYQVIIEIRPCDTITKWVKEWCKMFNQNNTELKLNVELAEIKSDCYVLAYDCYDIEWPETDSDESVEFEYEFQNDFVCEAVDC